MHSLTRMMKRARYIVPLLVLMMSLIAQAQDATDIPAQTLALIKVRGGAGTEYPVLTTLPFNTQIVIEARNSIGNWFLVRQDDLGARGWVASRYISWEDTTTPLANFAVSFEILSSDAAVTSAPTNPDATPLPTGTPSLLNLSGTLAHTLYRVNLRNAPDFNGGIITIVLYDATVSIQGRNARGNWLLVETESGQRGWIATRYLSWDTGEELMTFAVTGESVEPGPEKTLIAEAATVIPPSGAVATAGVPEQSNDGSIKGTVLVATLNIRATPEETGRKLAQGRMEELVYIEARNARGDWLLIRTSGEPAYRGWVASRFVGWADDVTPLALIPVSSETMGDAP